MNIKKPSLLAVCFGIFCLSMSIWQYQRMKEKQRLIKIASLNMERTIRLEDVNSSTPIFSLVAGRVKVSKLFLVRRSTNDGYVTKLLTVLDVPGGLLLVDLGCASSPLSQEEIEARWLIKPLPRRNRAVVSMLASFHLKEDLLPFLDYNLIRQKVHGEVLPFYLERIPQGFALADLFALDLSRSEILGFSKRVLSLTANKPLQACFDIIAPPSLHRGYIFEWLIIGFIGFTVLQFFFGRSRLF